MAATTLKEAIVQALNKAASAFYTPQILTPEQQEQARLNINAMSGDTSPSIPTGSLLPFAGIAVPDGYLLCNGAEISRTDYAALFAVIGEKWGAGDGSTTFTLPNFNDRFIEGTTDTSKVGQYLEAGAPNITGRTSRMHACDWVSTGWSGALYGTTESGRAYNEYSNTAPVINIDASRISSIYSTSETIQPTSAYVLIIIKA